MFSQKAMTRAAAPLAFVEQWLIKFVHKASERQPNHSSRCVELTRADRLHFRPRLTPLSMWLVNDQSN